MSHKNGRLIKVIKIRKPPKTLRTKKAALRKLKV
jgi:hypothetical protein